MTFPHPAFPYEAADLARFREVLLDALDAACGLEQLEYLRVDRGLTREQARDVVTFTMRALLRKGT